SRGVPVGARSQGVDLGRALPGVPGPTATFAGDERVTEADDVVGTGGNGGRRARRAGGDNGATQQRDGRHGDATQRAARVAGGGCGGRGHGPPRGRDARRGAPVVSPPAGPRTDRRGADRLCARTHGWSIGNVRKARELPL